MQWSWGVGQGFALESAGARINVYVRDLPTLMCTMQDVWRSSPRVSRFLELNSNDTTLVAAHHCDGTARPGTATRDGATMAAARRRKEATYPELGSAKWSKVGCVGMKLAAGGQPRLQHF